MARRQRRIDREKIVFPFVFQECVWKKQTKKRMHVIPPLLILPCWFDLSSPNL